MLEVTDGVAEDADAALDFADKSAFVDYLTGLTIADLADAGTLTITGDHAAAASFASYFDPAPDMARILITLHGPAPE